MRTVKTYNNYINESVRDKMTPIDTTEIDKKIVELFERARREDDIDIRSEIGYDEWEELFEKYNLFDCYYVYKGGVYTVYTNDNYVMLSYTFENLTKFKEKLESVIKKIDSLQ